MPWTPKLAFLLAEAPPEPDPLRPRLFPAAVAEVTLFTAPLTVPARPTPPLAAARLLLAGSPARLAAEARPGRGRVGRGIVCGECRVDPRTVGAK